MALINRSDKSQSGVLRAIARKRERYTHDVKAGRHTLTLEGAGLVPQISFPPPPVRRPRPPKRYRSIADGSMA